MEFQVEEQLNKLISAYNNKESPDEEAQIEDSLSASMDLEFFERKLKHPEKPKLSAKVAVQTPNEHVLKNPFDAILVPELPEGLKRQFKKQEIKLEEAKEIATVLASKIELDEEIKRLRFEEASAANEPIEKRLREATAKNKNLGVLLQRERASRISLESAKFGLEGKIKELREKLKLASEPDSEEKKFSAELKTKTALLEERLASANLKLGLAETELAKALKIIRAEVGEFGSLDELAKSECGWKGRAQKIAVLKSKLQQFKATNNERKHLSEENSASQGQALKKRAYKKVLGFL